MPDVGTASPWRTDSELLSLGDQPDLEPERCLRLFRQLAAGVTVVSTQARYGPVGMTVSAATSLSLRPPLLLACLSVNSATLAAIQQTRTFAVQLLAEDQHATARDFASPNGLRFASHEHRYVGGVPVLCDALAWSVCMLVDSRTYGDHVLVVGKIIAAHAAAGRPLVWHGERFNNIDALAGQ